MSTKHSDIETESINADDNTVEIYSYQNIESNDLEVILLYLENFKACGGGDILSHHLDENKRLLKVVYEHNRAKMRVLQKKSLNFLHFKLIASEPVNESKLALNDKTIIMQNVSSNANYDVVRLFAENLVINDDSDNDVAQLTKSGLFKDTYYVQFKLSIDYEILMKRLQRRPSLCAQNVSLVQAYATNSILVNKYDTNNNLISVELIEMYFANRKRCGAESYISIREREASLILMYENQETINDIFSKKHLIQNQELIIEQLLNYQLLEQELDFAKQPVEPKIAAETPKEKEKEENEILSKPSIETRQKINEDPLTYDYIGEKSKLLFLKEELYFPRFKDGLLSINASVTKRITPEGLYIVKMDQIVVNELNEEDKALQKDDEWTKKVSQYVEDFFGLFESKVEKIENQEILKHIERNCVVQKIDTQENTYEITGPTETFAEINILLQKIQMQIEAQKSFNEEIIDHETNGLKLFQIRILYVNKFVKLINEKYRDMLLKIDAKNRSVNFRGTRAQIKDANIILKDILDRIIVSTMPADDALIKLVLFKEIDIVTWLKEKVNII